MIKITLCPPFPSPAVPLGRVLVNEGGLEKDMVRTLLLLDRKQVIRKKTYCKKEINEVDMIVLMNVYLFGMWNFFSTD